jgi:hypothetical protein
MMMSPGMSAAGISPRPYAAAESRELKFMLPAGRVDLARRWLEIVCRRDREYPAARVWTVYYDTPQLASLSEKINSDYLKVKIRLRWYSETDQAPAGPVFIEAKSREGSIRTKVRVVIPHDAADVCRWRLQDPRLLSFPALLRDHGVSVRDLWQPVLLVRYRRDRFVEPVSGARVSLDAEIAAAAVNPRFLPATDPTPIGPGILEVKGDAEELPTALRPLLRLGARKRSFSKYLALYQHVTQSIC